MAKYSAGQIGDMVEALVCKVQAISPDIRDLQLSGFISRYGDDGHPKDDFVVKVTGTITVSTSVSPS